MALDVMVGFASVSGLIDILVSFFARNMHRYLGAVDQSCWHADKLYINNYPLLMIMYYLCHASRNYYASVTFTCSPVPGRVLKKCGLGYGYARNKVMGIEGHSSC